MYGSTLMNTLRTSSWSAPGSASSRSASSKSSGTGSPCGRRASRTSRLLMGVNTRHDPRNQPSRLPRMELEGRHVVVTGAASGIGRALALRFADEGARAVVVADLDEAGAQAVAEQVGGLAVRADVGKRGGHPRAGRPRRGGQRPDRPLLLQRRHHGAERRPGGARRRLGPAVARQHDVARVGGARAAARDARARRGLPRQHRVGRRACSPSSARWATRSPSTRRSRSPSGSR